MMKAYSEITKNSSGIFTTNSNIVKSFKLKRYNCIPHSWGQLHTAQGKELSRSALEALWTLCRFALYRKSDEIELDYAFLKRECGSFRSHAQIKRYLDDIQSAELINYELKRMAKGYKKKLYVKIDFLKIDSLGTSLSKGIFTRHVCGEYVGHYNKDKNNIKNKEVYREEEEYIYSDIYSSSSLKERKENDKVISFPKGSNNPALIADDKPKNKYAKANKYVTMEAKKKQISSMKNKEKSPQGTNADLFKEILRRFTPARAAEVIKNCKFTMKQPGKIEIKLLAGITFDENDKEKIRECLKITYGNDIRITQSQEAVIKKQEEKKAEVLSFPNTLQGLQDQGIGGEVQVIKPVDPKDASWETVKKTLCSFLPEKIREHTMNAYVDKLMVHSIDEISRTNPSKQIILKGDYEIIKCVTENFKEAIRNTAVKHQMNLMFSSGGSFLEDDCTEMFYWRNYAK